MRTYFKNQIGTLAGGSFVYLTTMALSGFQNRKGCRGLKSLTAARNLALAVGMFGVLAFCQIGNAVSSTASGTVLERQPSAQSSGLGIDILGIPTGIGVERSPEPNYDRNRVGAGIYVGTGQVVWDQEDFRIKGRDEVTDLVIKRRHMTGRNYTNSIFGPAWAFNYDHILHDGADGDIIVESFGRKDVFKDKSGGVWEGRAPPA